MSDGKRYIIAISDALRWVSAAAQWDSLYRDKACSTAGGRVDYLVAAVLSFSKSSFKSVAFVFFSGWVRTSFKAVCKALPT